MTTALVLRALAAAALTAALVASPASALTITLYNSDLPLPPGQQIIEDFDAVHADGVNFTFVAGPNTLERSGALGLLSGISAPPPGDVTDYFTVKAGGKATLTSLTGLRAFSFYLGSPDTYNAVKFFDTLGGSFTLNGAQIWGASGGADGNQTWGRRVSYDFEGSRVNKIEFTSSGNSFEFDSLAGSVGVPEPATWAMMILGFGAVGAVIRRRRASLSLA